jgi:PKD repeat protein
MTRVLKPICLVTVLALVLALGAAIVPISYTQASGDTYYVDASVVGPGTGTSGDPWKTITMALASVPGDPADPDTIVVAAGTYDAANGEAFPLTFANDGVVLVGADETVTFIDGGSAATILDVNAGVIVIDGFTITNSTSDATYGIEASDSSGNLEVTGNIFTNVDYGVYLNIDENGSNLSSDYTFADLLVNGNSFSFNDTGVYITFELDFDDTVTELNCDVGALEVSENDFDSGDYGIYFWGYVDDLTDSTATIGDLLLNDNTFTGISSESIYVYYWESWYLEGTTTVTCGDLEINGNTTDGGYGFYIYWEYIGYEMYDTASVTVGDAFINDNEITSDGSYGIYLYYYEDGIYLEDNTSVAIGELHVEGNTIDAYYEGIYLYYEYIGYELNYSEEGAANFTLGDAFIADNEITSSAYEGIYIYYYEDGYNLYYDASVTIGELHVEGNTIDADNEGIYFYFYECACYMEDNASMAMGDIHIVDNDVTADDDYCVYVYYDYMGYEMDDNASAEFPDFVITGNTFDSGYDECLYYEVYDSPEYIYDDAVFDMGGILIDDNTFTNMEDEGGYDGIYIYYDGFCYGNYNNSASTIGDVTISNNELNVTGTAVTVDYEDLGEYLEDYSTLDVGKLVIADNVIDGAEEGVCVDYYHVCSNDDAVATIGDLEITGNEVSNITIDDGLDIEWLINSYNDSTINFGSTLVQGNTVSNCDSSALDMDMYIGGDSTATVNMGDLEIDGNVFEDSSEGIWLYGVQNAQVTENDILNNESEETCGVYISDAEDWFGEGPDFPAQNNVFRCNNFEGNEPYGLENDGTGEVDAEENWWGDESGPNGEGPGHGDAVSSNVLYEPWLIAPCGEEEVVAGFTAKPPTGQAPLTVQFYDTSTGAATWFWEFGDGNVSEAQYPTHTYQNGGVYSVRLTIEGVGGDTDDASGEVIVEASATAPNLVVRNLYISAAQAQPRQQVVITADVFNEGGAWGSDEMQLLINGYYEQSAQVGVAPGTSQPISFTVYKVPAGEYQVTIGNATGTFYVVEEPQPSQLGSIPMDSGTLIALIVIGVFVIAAVIVVFVVLKPS